MNTGHIIDWSKSIGILIWSIKKLDSECFKFSIETTGEVSVACMLSFSYDDSIDIYHFIARIVYELAQAVHINLHELHGIFILILLQIK